MHERSARRHYSLRAWLSQKGISGWAERNRLILMLFWSKQRRYDFMKREHSRQKLRRGSPFTATTSGSRACGLCGITVRIFRSRWATAGPSAAPRCSPMASGRVQVTYSAPLIFLSSDQWSQIHRAIAAHMPLRNLHWKTASRPSIRTIQELGVNFVGFDTLRDEHASQIPASLLEKPLVNIYVVTCEVRTQNNPMMPLTYSRLSGQRRV